MNILVTGRGGTSGSWLMRGMQLGSAMGATVQPLATDVSGFDVAVVVKRTPGQVVQALRGRRWVWDIVDAYPQPESYAWGRSEAVDWVRGMLRTLKPTGVIWPNQRMRQDCDTGLPGLVLPHHHRVGIAVNPIRERVRRVGYEGAAAYIGGWEQVIRAQCERRGWEFTINPRRLSDLDIVLAMRDGCGYVSRYWKSGVKLVNAHGSGTPFVGQPEAGYTENASGAEYWAEDAKGLEIAFDWLLDHSAREAVSDRFLQKAYPVEQAAADLKAWLHAL